MLSKNVVAKFFLLSFLFFLNTDACAWVIDQNIVFLDFRFNNPGARANGMGGAFIGLADDATAAFTNPAGLTILTIPEVSIEYKLAEYTTTFNFANGSKDFSDTVDGVSFLNFAYPLEKATITIYRHQLLNLENSYGDPTLTLPSKAEIDIGAVTSGTGLGLKLTDTLSFGVSVGFTQLDYYSRTEHFNDLTYTNPPRNIRVVDSEDNAEYYTVAMLWNPFSEFNIGIVYRPGPEFKTNMLVSRDSDDDGLYEETLSQEHTVKIPDVYGVGVSNRFFPNLTAAVDINYIEYSDLLDDVIDLQGNRVPSSYSDIDDTYEFHIGLEYVFSLKGTPLAIRCGYYHRPDHRFRYTGPDPDFRARGRRGPDDDIYSLGFGAVLTENTQIDVAGSAGDLAKEYTASVVHRF